MTLQHIIGAILVSTPFLLFAFFIIKADGWKAFFFILFFTAVVLSIFAAGICLLSA